MDENIELFLETHPELVNMYKNSPIPHFYSCDPEMPLVDLYLGMDVSDYPALRPDDVLLFSTLINYEYGRLQTHKTTRGFSRKWRMTLDVDTGNQIPAKLGDIYFPMEELISIQDMKTWFLRDILPAAQVAYFPLLNRGADKIAKKMRITYNRDSIEYDERFKHDFIVSEDNVLLSVFVFYNTVPIGGGGRVILKSGDIEVSRSWSMPGHGIVTAPSAHPYQYKLETTRRNLFNEDEKYEGILNYFVFDFME